MTETPRRGQSSGGPGLESTCGGTLKTMSRPSESTVRELMERQLGVRLAKRRLVVGVASDGRERHHEFDGVSPDCQIIIEIKSNELKAKPGAAKGRYDSAIKQALVLDLYMLSRVLAKTKMLVLSDRALFDVCSQDMDGLLAADTKIVYCCASQPAG
jgi:hypothetical protein